MRQCLWGASRFSIATFLLTALVAKAQPPAAASALPADAAKADPFVVPNGTADELLRYLRGLNGTSPTSSSRESVVEYAKARYTAQTLAADKLLASQPTADQAVQAVRAKAAALENLSRLGDKTAAERLKAIPAEVAKLGIIGLGNTVDVLILESRLVEMYDHDAKKQKEIIDAIDCLLKEGPVDWPPAHLAVIAATTLEQTGKPAEAKNVYEKFGRILAASDDHHIAAQGAVLLGAARRLDLAGKPLDLEGKTVDGHALDWKSYLGKAVIVNFCADRSIDSHRDLQLLRKYFEKYHAQGLNIVSINVDHDRKVQEDFVANEKLPWPVVLDVAEATGAPQSMATYYGVTGVLPVILVGRDGRVIAANARIADVPAALGFGPTGKK
jgi:peroxiredoxin